VGLCIAGDVALAETTHTHLSQNYQTSLSMSCICKLEAWQAAWNGSASYVRYKIETRAYTTHVYECMNACTNKYNCTQKHTRTRPPHTHTHPPTHTHTHTYPPTSPTNQPTHTHTHTHTHKAVLHLKFFYDGLPQQRDRSWTDITIIARHSDNQD